MRRRRRLEQALALLLLCVAAAFFILEGSTTQPPPRSPQAGAGSVKPLAEVVVGHRYQELAALTASHEVFAAPGARPFERVSATRPITGEQTELPVVHTASRGRVTWVEVRLPGRPNGLTGWIGLPGTRLAYTPWHIVVNLAARRVYAYDAGRLVSSFEAIVGARATPTPKGQFFVEENVAVKRSAVGYPYALALSARSTVLQEFDGGPGQIALHGLDNVGGTLGTAVSHGCIRLDTSAVTWLAEHVDPGVPVTVN